MDHFSQKNIDYLYKMHYETEKKQVKTELEKTLETLEPSQKEKRGISFTCKALYAIAKEIRKLFIGAHLSKSQGEKNEWEGSVKGRYIRTRFGYTEVICKLKGGIILWNKMRN